MNIISQENIEIIEPEPTHQIVELNIVTQPVSSPSPENFAVEEVVAEKGILYLK